MRLTFGGLLMGLCLLVSACAETVYAPESEVRKYAYRHPSPPSITLITMVDNRYGRGGHSSLVINGSQRIMYDPAGSWTSVTTPERNDVLFGITPKVLQVYNSYHARTTHHVVLQTVNVSPQVAAVATKAALEQGASGFALCANNITLLLQKIPGFQSVSHSFSPIKTMESFARFPGVKTEKIYEDDEGQNITPSKAKELLEAG